MVKKKKRPNPAVEACPEPPSVHVPHARVPITAKKPTPPTAKPILLVVGWLIFYLLFTFIPWLFFLSYPVPFFLVIIITIVSFLGMGVWSFRASEPNARAIVGGILVMIAAGISVINGSFALLASLKWLWAPPPTGYELTYYSLLPIGFFALIGFALGLAAGIQFLRRKQFRFAMFGTSLLTFAGLSNFLHGAVLVLEQNWPLSYFGFVWGFLFGTPIAGFALLGLVFVVTGKQEFTSARNT
jgi:hypothetical protein